MSTGNVLHNRKAEACAAGIARATAINAVKTLG
jgi:hypothetical protein